MVNVRIPTRWMAIHVACLDHGTDEERSDETSTPLVCRVHLVNLVTWHGVERSSLNYLGLRHSCATSARDRETPGLP